MNELDPTPDLSDPAPPLPRRRLHLEAWLNPALVLGVIAILLVLLVWLLTYRQIGNLNTELAQRLTAFDTRGNESRILAGQAQEGTRDVQVKIGMLEQKLAESQNQQIALEALYQELARGRDETVLAEIEQLLVSASHELQLAGNVRAALIALQSADARLQRHDRPHLLKLRKAVAKDIELLRAAPFVDIPGLTLKIDGLIEIVDTLPLLPGKPVVTTPKPPIQKAPELNWWQRFAREAWADFTNLVRVQNLEKAQLPLLAPEQAYFARENIKLRLLSARLSLLAHDGKSYKADLKAAQNWLRQYYDEQDKSVKDALATLQQLSASQLQVDVPDISGSLAAVRSIKLAPERGSR